MSCKGLPQRSVIVIRFPSGNTAANRLPNPDAGQKKFNSRLVAPTDLRRRYPMLTEKSDRGRNFRLMGRRRRDPAPFWWAARNCYYLQVGKKQIKLDPDLEEAKLLAHAIHSKPRDEPKKA